MEKEKVPLTPEEKPPRPMIEYDGLSASHSPIDEKCEKLLPDNYDSMVCSADEDYTYGSSSVGGCCGGGRTSGGGGGGRKSSGDRRSGVMYEKPGAGGGGMRLLETGSLMEGVGSSAGGCVGLGGVGPGNNNNCERQKPLANNKKKKKSAKNCKVNIVQPTDSKEQGVVAKKLRKNSREPEIRDTNLVLALFVLFCFNLPFGLLATMFSLMAGSAFRNGKRKRAKCHSRTSMVISLLGIATTAALVMCVIFFLAIKEQNRGY